MKARIRKLLINKNISIRQAMKQMGEGAEKILFVVSGKSELVGSLTDGDIREWILADGSLSETVEKVFNKNPVYVKKEHYIDEVKKIMIEKKLEWIPLVDDSNMVQDVYLWEDIFSDGSRIEKKKINIPVVIMAGGKGARLDPFTRILPKPLVPIGEKPVVEIIMDNFYEAGCKDFHLVLGYKGEMIKSYFDNTPLSYKIKYIWEKDPLGTIGGLKLLPQDMPDTFFVSNCDIIIKADYSDIYDFHIRNNYQITLVGSMKHFTIPYGIIEIGDRGELKGMIEKPEYDFLVNTGMYLVQKDILNIIQNNKMLHLTDLVKLVKENKKGEVGVYPVNEQSWFDIGQWEKYRETVKKINI